MDDNQHIELLDKIKKIKGMAIISGFDSKLYKEKLNEWNFISNKVFGQSGGGKVSKINIECLWISPCAFNGLKQLSFNYGNLD